MQTERRTPFIVAEISCNHSGSLNKAFDLINAAADAGADAVKFQIWEKGTMCVDRGYVVSDGPWQGHNLWELYEEAFTPWEWFPHLFEKAKDRGLWPFASVFDIPSLTYMQQLRCPIYKIASFELPDLNLIKQVALMRKPIVLSTGMAEQWEIREAVDTVRSTGNRDLTLLHCKSAYPTDPADLNLSTMWHLQQSFGCDIGFSDHTRGIGAAISAAGFGARMIEKHLVLEGDDTLDAGFAITPRAFDVMVQGCREAVGVKGVPGYTLCDDEKPQKRLRRSLYWTRDLEPGHIVTEADLVTARPAMGVTARNWHAIIGTKVLRQVFAHQPVRYDQVQKDSPWLADRRPQKNRVSARP